MRKSVKIFIVVLALVFSNLSMTAYAEEADVIANEFKTEMIDENTYKLDFEGTCEMVEEEKAQDVESNDAESDHMVEDISESESEVIEDSGFDSSELREELPSVKDETENAIMQTGNTVGWFIENGKKYYAITAGTKHKGWLSFGSTYYYCGSDGAIVTGKQSIGGKLYYFAEGQDINSLEYGKRKTGWIEPEDGKKYYGMPDGSLRVGWLSFGSTYYYCGSDGAILKGVHVIDEVVYEFNENGVRQKTKAGWQVIDGKRYYGMPDGTYRVGWLSFGSTYYYCGSDGAIVTGKQSIGGKLYYFAEGQDINSLDYGKRKTGWIEPEDGKKYYGMPDGSLRVGWLSFGSTYYYCGGDGAIVKGIHVIDGAGYEFDENGVRQKAKTGWLTRDGKKYYGMPDGTYRVGWLSFGKTYYYCGNDAAIICSQDYPVNGVLYTFDQNGVRAVKPGWGEYNGKKYYINPGTGFPYTGWVSFGSTYYYADKNGLMVSGWQTIDGYRYYFYPDTNKRAVNTTIDGIRLDSNGRASQAYTYAANILNQVGWNLRAAFNWSSDLKYETNVANASPGSEWFAIYGFRNGRGNCYVTAATFYYMADLLGYDVHQVSGYVGTRNGGKTPHSWCEIVINGTIYVFDPNFENETGRNGYQIRYGTSGTWRYVDYYRMN